MPTAKANPVSCQSILANNTNEPKSLDLVPKSDPILRQVMPAEQNFKDPALQDVIVDMCHSILPEQLKEPAAGMAANQWGLPRRVFIYSPDEIATAEVVINPSCEPYLPEGETQYKVVHAYEACFSVPLATGLVERYDAIKATYYTPNGEKIERILQGWEARVFQHETDHLDGKLYDGQLDNYSGPTCLDRIVFKDRDAMENWFDERRRARAKE